MYKLCKVADIEPADLALFQKEVGDSCDDMYTYVDQVDDVPTVSKQLITLAAYAARVYITVLEALVGADGALYITDQQFEDYCI